jgi:hypothetical protein
MEDQPTHAAREFRDRALEYRTSAETAHTTEAVNSLLRLAARFDALADECDAAEAR